MPNAAFEKTFTQNDRRTAIADDLKDGDGLPIDLTGHTVAFRMVKKSDSSVKVNNAPATVDSPATSGKVSYAWGASDLDTASSYWYFWVVTRTSDSKTERFPGDGKKATLNVVAVV